MRDIFDAYLPPTEDELNKIWANGTIVLDTNVLLNLFRYAPGTTDEFLAVLRGVNDQLWLPHHVGKEFHLRRPDVIANTERAYDKVDAAIKAIREAAEKDLKTVFGEQRLHPSLDAKKILGQVGDFYEGLGRDITAQRSKHVKENKSGWAAEATLSAVHDLYEGRVGVPFTDERIDEIHREGEDRYKRHVPPGYKDNDKSNSNRFGDLILWKEILKWGEKTGKPLIFVTDDAKEDWWWRTSGMTQGARPELIAEYRTHTGQRAHFYSPQRFLEYAKEKTQSKVSSDSIDEVKRISAGQQETLSFPTRRALGLRPHSGVIRESSTDSGSPTNSDVTLIRQLTMELERQGELESSVDKSLAAGRRALQEVRRSSRSDGGVIDEEQLLSDIYKLERDLAAVQNHRRSLEFMRELVWGRIPRGDDAAGHSES
ncbi:PIN-like domain-containing protein [Schaalia sp. JY-X169]|uniref:PIN-like domain-containing protein n=1 Tax=Schaalia sp. JY-X169 TaxID=2758572 RepID=UPI0015F64C8F|nr:PIN domain-containing protein [Schaalia sp. JY-X169]